MNTHRFAGAFIALALLISSFALTLGTANAATSDPSNVVVTGSVADTISLSLNRGTIRFGDAMTFTGQTGPNSDVVDVCTNPAQTGVTGARFVGPNVVATVISSRAYTVNRGSLSIPSILNTHGRVGNGAYDGCAGSNFASAVTVATAVLTPQLGSSASGTPLSGTSYTEFYMFDVLVNDNAGSLSCTITYWAAQVP